MTTGRLSRATAILVVACLLDFASEARAGLQLQIANNGYSQLANADPTSPGELFYRNTTFNNSNLSISGIEATSTSSIDGPAVYSQLSISSFSVTNKTNIAQTVILTLTDTGFDPDSAERPLTIYNTASATSSSYGHLSYQTFAFDGTGMYVTSGPGVVETQAVSFDLPFSGGGTTTAFFSPHNDQFSLTTILTIDLAAYATITGFNGLSLVHAPEPGTICLALSGIPMLIFVGLRRRRAKLAA